MQIASARVLSFTRRPITRRFSLPSEVTACCSET